MLIIKRNHINVLLHIIDEKPERMTNLMAELKYILKHVLSKIKPELLVPHYVTCDGNKLVCRGKSYALDDNVYVVGFGKATYGMFTGLYPLIERHLVSAVLSIPFGCKLHNAQKLSKKIEVYEGAMNNLPDVAAIRTATRIAELVSSLSIDDILILLISGGGSALLPSPVEGISLEEKLIVTKLVANSGGNIKQLNTIRKVLSSLKGGKLVEKCPSRNILSLIVSDIVNDPIEFIASGPSVFDRTSKIDCLKIFSSLNIKPDSIPSSVLNFLSSSETEVSKGMQYFNEVCSNVIIGSNKLLVSETDAVSSSFNYETFTITASLEGDAERIGERFARVAFNLLSENKSGLMESLDELNSGFDSSLLLKCLSRKVCLITAGETTVNVRGSGKGGRNQHLVLTFIGELKRLTSNETVDTGRIGFLSAGTDGQDGCTDATGACITGDILQEEFNVESYLSNSDSYTFFSHHFPDCLLKTGLTGTNLMDVQVLLINRKEVT